MKHLFTFLSIALLAVTASAATYTPITISLSAGEQRDLPYAGEFFYVFTCTNASGDNVRLEFKPRGSGDSPIILEGRQGFQLLSETITGLTLRNPTAATLYLSAQVSTGLRVLDNRFAVAGAALPVTFSGTVPTTANVTNTVAVIVTNTVTATNLLTAGTPATLTQTNAATGTPVALTNAATYFQVAVIKAIKPLRVANTGTVYLGATATDDAQPIDLSAGNEYVISAAANQKLNLANWYLDVATAGDGVTVTYW